MWIAGFYGLVYFLTLSIALAVWLVVRPRIRRIPDVMLRAIGDAPVVGARS